MISQNQLRRHAQEMRDYWRRRRCMSRIPFDQKDAARLRDILRYVAGLEGDDIIKSVNAYDAISYAERLDMVAQGRGTFSGDHIDEWRVVGMLSYLTKLVSTQANDHGTFRVRGPWGAINMMRMSLMRLPALGVFDTVWKDGSGTPATSVPDLSTEQWRLLHKILQAMLKVVWLPLRSGDDHMMREAWSKAQRVSEKISVFLDQVDNNGSSDAEVR